MTARNFFEKNFLDGFRVDFWLTRGWNAELICKVNIATAFER
jgi:hypothetical protein